jgi:hypothetical protein
MSKKIAIYTIAYSADLLEQENGFLSLNNTQNERPDWREYWPIRSFLLSRRLDDECYYGFFSPRFREKTGLGSGRVIDFVNSCQADTDAVIFSPQPDVGAFFPNVFAGEEQADPGFLATSQRFVELSGLGIDLSNVVMDSSTIVFSNYLAARPRFWKIWLELGERLFEIAENKGVDDRLRKELLQATNYPGGVQRKVFLMERLASLVLVTNPDLRVRVFDPFVLGWSTQLNRFRDEAVICDSLKVAINQLGFPGYRQVYDAICRRVIRSALGTNRDAGLKADPLAGVANADLLGLIPAGSWRIAEIAPRGNLLSTTYLDANPDARWVQVAHVVTDESETQNSLSECDVVLWEGALEYEQDPVKALSVLRSRMEDDAALVISFDNARHWRFQAQLALGSDSEWPDSERELCSRRRFTRPQFFRLLDHCGFRLDAAVARVFSPPDADRYLHNIGSMASLGGGDPKAAEDDARVLQYVVRARAKTPVESPSSRPALS